MITINLILQQWQGILGYDLRPLPGNPELPADLLTQLLKSGLDMYIRRYLFTTVHHPINTAKPRPCIVYHVNPHTRQQPLYLSTEDNTLYELVINFDNLDAPH
jgi:hypothetical protein